MIGQGTDAESVALESALSAIADADFARLRVCYNVPGRPRGPHVSATQLIEAVVKTGHSNASHMWTKLKAEGFLEAPGRHMVSHRMPGQRGGRPSDFVDVPTALQIIMTLPGKTAAKVRVKAYGVTELLSYLHEHHPEHELCKIRQSVEAGQTQAEELELESRAKRARVLRDIAADEEATAASIERTAVSNEATTMSKERATRVKEIVSADVAERGIAVFNQINALVGLNDRERIALRARVTTSLLGIEQAQPARCEVIVENFLREHRSGVSPSLFGRKAAAIWNALHPGETHPKKRVVLANGQAVDVNIYYTEDIEPVLLPALQQCASPAPSPAPSGSGDLRRHLPPSVGPQSAP